MSSGKNITEAAEVSGAPTVVMSVGGIHKDETVLAAAAVATLPVTVDPLSPKLTPLELEKTTCPRATLAVPADIDPAATPAPTEAVTMLPALVPNVIPFAFEKPNV